MIKRNFELNAWPILKKVFYYTLKCNNLKPLAPSVYFCYNKWCIHYC